MSGRMKTRRLGDPDVAEVILGQSPPSSAYNTVGTGLPFFQGKADFGLLHPTPRMWCHDGSKFAAPGDVLVSVRAPVGDVNIASNDCIIGRGVAAIRAAPTTDPWYLYFSLLHSKPVLESRATGTTFASVNKATLNDLEIPFCDRDEQVRIGKALRQLIEKIQQEDRVVQTATETKGAAMHSLFTRGLTGEPQKESEAGPVPESWCVEPLRTHYSVVSGGTPSRRESSYWAGGSIPWVKTGEVDYCVIESTDEQITPEGLAESAAKLLPVGTLLLAMYGQGVTRGKVAILGIEAACNQACAAIRPIDDYIERRYLYHYLVSRYSAIRQLAHGGQQQNLNLDIVRDLPVAYPADKSEQNKLAAILDALDRKIRLHQRKRAVLENLFKSLLHGLMTGEITVDEMHFSVLDRDPAEEVTV